MRRSFRQPRARQAGDVGRVSPRGRDGPRLLAAAGSARGRAELAGGTELRTGRSDAHANRPERESAGPIRIVYATSRTQDPLCEIFRPALARILSRYGDRVEVHFWGCRVPQLAAANVHHHGLVCGYDRYLRRFSRAGYDIGLAPLPDDVFHRSKTNNKFREYGASGIAGVYSANDVYAHCVEHEVSGLLVANDTESWHAALERLIDDEPLPR